MTWGRDRAESIERMRAALARTAVLGVVTNLSRLRAILAHPAFAEGDLHTGFLDEHLAEFGAPASASAGSAAGGDRGACAVAAARRRRGAASRADPWASLGAWRLA